MSDRPNSEPLADSRWEAFGTSVVLRVNDATRLRPARAAVESELAAVDHACSRFRPDSELSRLNTRAGRTTAVSPLLIEALELALRGAELTDGDVDPTLGRALELAGYDRDWRALDPPRELRDAAEVRITAHIRSGWREVELDAQRATVRLPRGMRLDLGASAKAWAADRAAAAARIAADCGVLVAIGGDIATAGRGPREGWQVRVTDDHRSDLSAPGQSVTISSGGLATSSTAVRRWSHAGQDMHHIIDPRTAAPVRTTWRTVSVAAGSCADANIATTAALVRAHAARAWLADLELPARLVAWDGSVTTVASWPQAQEH